MTQNVINYFIKERMFLSFLLKRWSDQKYRAREFPNKHHDKEFPNEHHNQDKSKHEPVRDIITPFLMTQLEFSV